ncbi:MAG: TadE/TadG family type IV pilus assembly protein [Pseudomonadota bacterium]
MIRIPSTSSARLRTPLLGRRPRRLRGFWRDRAGMAATEFAMIAPILLVLFFGVVEASDALTAGRRLTLATNTLADLVAQDIQITHADLNGLFSGMEEIAVTTDAASTFRVVSLVYDDDDARVEVDWSRDDNGGTPYAAGAAYTGLADTSILNDTSSVIVTEAELSYKPSLTDFVIQTITMERQSTRWPRRAARVQLCATAATCS